MKKAIYLSIVCFAVLAASCNTNNNDNVNRLNGTWRRTSTVNGCENMTIHFDNGEGTVTYSPVGCCFQTGDIKWKDYNPNANEVDDMVRQISTCILQPYEMSSITFYNNYTEANVGGIYFVKE